MPQEEPEREQDLEVTLRVRITTFGKPTKARAEVMRHAARALHRSFGDTFTIEDMHFDSFADDGNHEGHGALFIPATQ